MNPLTGRALWSLLHGSAHACPEGPLSPELQAHLRAWLESFDAAVAIASQHSCPCSQHWRAIVAANPPDLVSRRSFFWWTVAVHNAVNTKLGKPVFSF